MLLRDTIRRHLHTNFSTNHHYHSISNISVPLFLCLCRLPLISVLIFSEPNRLFSPTFSNWQRSFCYQGNTESSASLNRQAGRLFNLQLLFYLTPLDPKTFYHTLIYLELWGVYVFNLNSELLDPYAELRLAMVFSGKWYWCQLFPSLRWNRER